MPTENETKFALKLECEAQVHRRAAGHQLIEQGYLFASRGTSVRVRSAVKGVVDGHFRPNPKATPCYSLAFKCRVGDRVVEVEKKLDERDFRDLWSASINRLVKVRADVPAGALTWEIDFFKDHNDQTYFALAELELPEGEHPPWLLPPIINDNLLFQVPLTDSRFASKFLGDVRYATALYLKLKGE